MIPFGRLKPDAGEMEPGAVMVADGVVPLESGYGPAPALSVSASSVALNSAPRGMQSLVLNDGTWKVYAFTATDIGLLQSDGSWSYLTAGLNVTAGDDVSSCHFGDYLVFSDTTDGLNYYNVETPGAITAVAAAGAPRFIFPWGTQLVGLDCLDDGGGRNNRLMRISDFNSFTDWTDGGSDYQPLEDGGRLVWGCDLQDGGALILQERAVRLLQFGNAGGGAMFSQRKVADGLGAVGQRSAVTYSGLAFWLATDGFVMFSRGGGFKRIGAGRVDEWFFSQADQSALATVQGQIDPFGKMVWWRYKHIDVASESVFQHMIGYSWQWDCWVTGATATAYLANIATPGVTLDSIDTLYPTLDEIDIPLDSRAFQGGEPVFGGLNGALKFGTFTGSNQAATITTATANSGNTNMVQWATPIDDAANATLELGVKNQPSDALTWKAAASKGTTGRVPLRGRGHNLAFRYKVAAGEDWSYARGIDHVRFSSGGAK